MRKDFEWCKDSDRGVIVHLINGKRILGTVDSVNDEYITIYHNDPVDEDGQWETYRISYRSIVFFQILGK